MKVKELIQELNKVDPEAEVILSVEDQNFITEDSLPKSIGIDAAGQVIIYGEMT